MNNIIYFDDLYNEVNGLHEASLPKIIIPRYLYHGATNKYDYLLSTGIDLGNKFQEPGFSLYTWKDKDKAFGWAIFACLKEKIIKYTDYERRGCINSHIAILTTPSYNSIVANLDNIPDDDKTFYIYTILNYTLVDCEFGLGHSSNTPECITIRSANKIPIYKTEKYVLDKDLLDRYTIIDDKPYTNTEMGMNKRILSLLMTHDMMYNMNTKKALSKALHNGELSVGDDIVDFMKNNNIEFNDISFIDRISDRIHNR